MSNSKIRIFLLNLLMSVSSGMLFAQNNINVSVTDFDYSPIKPQMEKNSSALLTSINTAYSNKTKPLKIEGMTDYAYSTLLQIWEVSNFRCVEMDILERAIKTPKGGYELRNIPVYVSDAKEKEQDVVLVFDNNGAIEDIYNALTKHIYDRILQANDTTDFRRRQIILDFIENFRTSYNRRDIEFLEKVYSDDALIITGQVIEVTKIDGGASLPRKIIRYNKQSKARYISNLKTTFKNVSYININFSDIEVKMHSDKHDNLYFVTLEQDWNTTGYRDKGYLTLLIDFTNEDQPLIDVRTWSPEKIKLNIIKLN